MQCTPRNNLQKLDPEDIALVASIANNMDIIDAALAKCNFAGTREPGPGDDSDDGYSIGSKWFYSGRIFTCFSAVAGAASWLQTYGPGGDIDAATLDGHDSTYFAVATKGVTNGDAHDHSGGDGAQITYSSLGGIPSSFVPSAHKTSHQSGGADAIKLDDLAAPDDNTDLNVSTTKHGLCPKTPNDTSQFLRGDGTWAVVDAGSSFWEDVPGTPTRVSDTQFTVTGDYSRLLSKGTVLTWLEGATWQCAIITSSSYGAPNTTVNISGCSLTVGFSGMKYGMEKAHILQIIIPGTTAVANNPIGGAHRIEVDAYPLAIDYWVKDAGTTNALGARLNDDGVDIGGNGSIASGALTDFGNVPTDSTSAIAADSVMTADITTIHSSPATDLYVRLWYMPASWRDLM